MRSCGLQGTASFVLFAALLSPQLASGDSSSTPADWLRRMSQAVTDMDYEGTVIRRQNGRAEALKIVHKVVDGVVNERLVTQEGNGLEIVRVGTEAHCILPDRKSVLIEHWDNESTLYSALPDSDLQFAAHYDLSIVREERVAGRPAMLLAVRPHDQYRFGHRLWLDRETAFPLKTELLDHQGEVIEEIKFADIRLGEPISSQSLSPPFSLEGFTWYTEASRTLPVPSETDWISDDLPAGFRALSTTTEKLPGAQAPLTHIVYGDGLAAVSVFVGEKAEKTIAERARLGPANSYSTDHGEFRVTAVGEVPAETVRRIARSMRRR